MAFFFHPYGFIPYRYIVFTTASFSPHLDQPTATASPYPERRNQAFPIRKQMPKCRIPVKRFLENT